MTEEKKKQTINKKKTIVFLLIFIALIVGVYSLKEIKRKGAESHPQAHVTRHNF